MDKTEIEKRAEELYPESFSDIQPLVNECRQAFISGYTECAKDMEGFAVWADYQGWQNSDAGWFIYDTNLDDPKSFVSFADLLTLYRESLKK